MKFDIPNIKQNGQRAQRNNQRPIEQLCGEKSERSVACRFANRTTIFLFFLLLFIHIANEWNGIRSNEPNLEESKHLQIDRQRQTEENVHSSEIGPLKEPRIRCMIGKRRTTDSNCSNWKQLFVCFSFIF